MKITEKIRNKANGLYNYRQPVIAFSGDSVTQGCFEVYVKPDGNLETVFDSSECYGEKVKKIFSMLFPAANITVANAGISGNSADVGYKRLNEDVLSLKPDLTVVCYGLNDHGRKQDGLELYKTSLKNIFDALKDAGSEIIFMTPNMCTDRVDVSIKEEPIKKCAEKVAGIVNDGWLDTYIEAAKQVCRQENVPVCDCYKIWKTLDKNGVDVTSLLSNKINHPTKQLHWLFAYELVKLMLEN